MTLGLLSPSRHWRAANPRIRENWSSCAFRVKVRVVVATTRLTNSFREAADFLTLPVEDVAEVLIVHLNSHPDGGNEVAQMGRVNQQGFFNVIEWQRVYSDFDDAARRVLLEAWSWLESEGLIAREPTTMMTFFITRRGRSVRTRADFVAYRQSNLLPNIKSIR